MEKVDQKILDFFVENRNDFLSELMRFFSSLVEIKFAILVLLSFSLFLFLSKQKNKIIPLFLSIFLATGATIFLKNIFDKSRPAIEALVFESSYSFPSAHSAIAVALYGFVLYTFYKSKIKIKNLVCFLLSILIIMVGTSRIYLGVHYPSDVIAGFVVGLSSLLIALAFSKSNFWLLRDDKRL